MYLFFVSLAPEDMPEKILPREMSEILLLMVLGFTFKSLVHLEFILLCGIRRWASLILLHVSVQFFQNHLF